MYSPLEVRSNHIFNGVSIIVGSWLEVLVMVLIELKLDFSKSVVKPCGKLLIFQPLVLV